ncbi:MAG: DUF2284 domain-containing protein [Eubacteriales bacterium]|nr:DUF2284 domain-containing protein [Eubacteriales bacterium]
MQLQHFPLLQKHQKQSNSNSTCKSFRKYCEENLCGFYGKNYACPPYCGTPEEMEEKVRKHQNALVLKTSYEVNDAMGGSAMNPLKKKHTKMTLSLIKEILKEDSCDYIGVMAGPCFYCPTCKMAEGKPCTCENMRFSCLSAYCIDVTKRAEICDMKISWDIHSVSFFSIYLF